MRGFTEAFIEDLRTSAPQVRAVVVLPGARAGLIRAGLLPASPTAGDLRATPEAAYD